jgi:hypothetical protein
MKTTFKCLFMAALFLVTLVMAQPAFSYISEVGEVMTITGDVYECDATGSGIQIDTSDGIVTVYGKGPVWYWEQQGVEFPEVGEWVSIEAYEITFSDGTTKLVAMSIDIGDEGIELRDEDGTPLWRQHGKNIFQNQAQTQTQPIAQTQVQTQARNGSCRSE